MQELLITCMYFQILKKDKVAVGTVIHVFVGDPLIHMLCNKIFEPFNKFAINGNYLLFPNL